MSLRWDADRSKVDAQLAADVDEMFAHIPGNWIIVFGKRLRSLQAKLRADYEAGTGGFAAPAGHSAHEGGDDDAPGLAIDFCELVDGKESWVENDAWRQIWEYCRNSPRMHSGHFFPPVADADDDHIQSTKWYTVRSALQAAGKW